MNLESLHCFRMHSAWLSVPDQGGIPCRIQERTARFYSNGRNSYSSLVPCANPSKCFLHVGSMLAGKGNARTLTTSSKRIEFRCLWRKPPRSPALMPNAFCCSGVFAVFTLLFDSILSAVRFHSVCRVNSAKESILCALLALFAGLSFVTAGVE